MISSKLNDLLDRLRRQLTENTVKSIFYVITLVGLVVLTIVSIVIRGATLEAIFFSPRYHYFTDYFNSIYYSLNGPYLNHNVIYPPLITVAYEAIGIALEWGHSTFSNGFEIRDYPLGMLSYVISVIVAIVAIYFILQKSSKISKREALIFFLIVITSYPMLYCIDRGNSMMFSVIFIALFLMFYNSENKKMRYLAYIFLGIAIAIKIYPGLFGLLVLRRDLEQRNLKDTLICAVICALIFFLPFLITDGTFIDMLHNATSYSENAITFGQVNIIAMFESILIASGVENYTSYRSIWHIVSYFILFLIVVSVLFDKKMPKWHVICLLSGSQVLCAGLGTEYLLLYMVIPAWYFINSNPDQTRENIVYGVILAAILLSIPGSAEINIFSFVKGMFTLTLVITLLAKSCDRMYNVYKTRKKAPKPSFIEKLNDY